MIITAITFICAAARYFETDRDNIVEEFSMTGPNGNVISMTVSFNGEAVDVSMMGGGKFFVCPA